MTEEFEKSPEWIRRTADDGTGNLDDVSGIEADVAAQFQIIGTVVTDEVDLPVDAHIRLNGSFFHPDDARKYLESGGLIAYDTNGEPIPLPWVYFLKTFNDILQEEVWQVYIRDDSD